MCISRDSETEAVVVLIQQKVERGAIFPCIQLIRRQRVIVELIQRLNLSAYIINYCVRITIVIVTFEMCP